MAKINSKILVAFRSYDGMMEVTCDADIAEEIPFIEGVTRVGEPNNCNRRRVWTDARYDRNEIADEIRALAS